jgi:hypothetical protein
VSEFAVTVREVARARHFTGVSGLNTRDTDANGPVKASTRLTTHPPTEPEENVEFGAIGRGAR